MLATSLKQSLERLKSGWLFEKYWTKSTRKKNSGDVPNPDGKSMQKLGVCTMTIEPHVLEVTLYSVKGASVTFLPPISHPNVQRSPVYPSYYRSPLAPAPAPAPASSQMSPASTAAPSPLNRTPSLQQSLPTTAPKQDSSIQANVKSQINGSSDSSSKLPSLVTAPLNAVGTSPQSPQTQQPQHQQNPTHQSTLAPTPQRPQSSSQPSAQTPDSVSSTNPVIQMLAQRASTDAHLKSLMKIVANGEASDGELKIFQRHIDELNSIIKGTHAPPGQSSMASPSHSSISAAHPIQAWSAPATTPLKQEPLSQYYSQQPQYAKPKAPSAPKPDISAIVFDFTGSNGDRYLIPKKSILEYLSGSPQVLVSFLVARKGSEADQGKYRSNSQYYQPVTIKLSCQNHKVLEPLAKVVEPQDSVRKYMEDVMAKGSRAEDIYVATRLAQNAPEHQQNATDTNGLEMHSTHDLAGYNPPNSILPLRPSLDKSRL